MKPSCDPPLLEKFIQIVSSIIPWKLLLNMTAIQRYFVILFNNTFLTIPMKLRTKMLNRRSFLNGLILISENREKSGSKKGLISNTFDSILQSTFLFNIHIPFYDQENFEAHPSNIFNINEQSSVIKYPSYRYVSFDHPYSIHSSILSFTKI